MDYSFSRKLQCFKQISQEKLQAILCTIPSPKDLIIEPELIKPLEHICVASWVKSKGIRKIYKFDQKNAVPRDESDIQVFLISANLITFKYILDQIRGHESVKPSNPSSGIKSYHIIVFPNVLTSFDILLEEEGLYGIVDLYRFNWDFINLDDCILSLEIPQIFSEIFVRKDLSLLSSVAHSLRILNMISGGKPDMMISYGYNSSKLLDMILRLDETKKSTLNSSQANLEKCAESDFSALILIDRDKDYPSCLLTPAVYSGLMLELFKYRSGELEITKNVNKISSGKLKIFQLPNKKIQKVPNKSTTTIEVEKPQNSKSTTTIVRMNKNYDEIFGENRYKHFAEASNLVRAQAKALGLEVQNINKMKINEMHDYVAKKLPKITEMKNKITKHLNICEGIINELADNFQEQQNLEEDIVNNRSKRQILNKVDEMLTIDGHRYNIIRLLCLVHLSMGISTDELSGFIRNYCNVFGHKYLYIFQNLANVGLLPEIYEGQQIKGKFLSQISIPKFQQTEFQVIANRLKLLQIDSEKNSSSSSSTAAGNTDVEKTYSNYVFNGIYTPLIAQLSSILLKSSSMDDVSNAIGSVEKIQFYFSDYQESRNIKTIQQAVKKGQLTDKFPIKKKNIFIFVLGGVTYAEIAACDFVAKVTGSKIIVSSNCIFAGSDLIANTF